MNEDILGIIGFFGTIVVLALGVPIVRAWARKKDREPVDPAALRLIDERLARIERAVDAMAIEIERVSEGQRFVTRILGEKEGIRGTLPSSDYDVPQ